MQKKWGYLIMPMVKDYLENKFKHNIEAGKLQFGVAQETTSMDTAFLTQGADAVLKMFKDGMK